jgi:hypothetical protein
LVWALLPAPTLDARKIYLTLQVIYYTLEVAFGEGHAVFLKEATVDFEKII